jgi:hypothetical protein
MNAALLQDFLDSDLKQLPPGHWKVKFRANRFMQDVEPSSSLWARTVDGFALVEDDA